MSGTTDVWLSVVNHGEDGATIIIEAPYPDGSGVEEWLCVGLARDEIDLLFDLMRDNEVEAE